MMIQGFEMLSEEQFDVTKKAITWITILIAGADGEIEKEETEWAKKIAHIRSYHNPNELTPFYEEVGKDFSSILNNLLDQLPVGTNDRQELLIRQLSKLNNILPILDNNLGHLLLKSYRSFAKHVAKASGGFLGFLSVGKEEDKLIDLPMLNDIPFVDTEVS